MKTFKLFSVAILSLAFVSVTNAQTKTESFKVSGNCGMCKSTIEKAAKEAGAKSASWDVDTKNLTVTYMSSTTNAAKIQEKIAAVGYDNVGFKATTASYDKLHSCCKYDRSMTAVAEKKASCCSDEATCKEHGENHGTAKADCCKDGKCTKPGHDGKDCCKEGNDCCKDGKCTKEGHDGKDCCKKADK